MVEKYRQIKTQIEEDEKLMLTVLETEEFYTNKWLKWRSESLQCRIRDINTVLKSSQSVLQEENDIIFLQVHITVYSLLFICSYIFYECYFFTFSLVCYK